MKRTGIILLLFLFVFSYSNAKNAKAWVKELDLINIDSIPKNSISTFWQRMTSADMEYYKLQKAIKKNNKSIRTAQSNIADFIDKSKFKRFSLSLTDSSSARICLTLEWDLHIQEIKEAFPEIAEDKLRICLANDRELNASTFPDGYILINAGLLTKLNYQELLAVCAHELAHYMFRHSLSNQYAYIKKKKSNKLWAGIGGGLLIGMGAFANGYAAGYTGQNNYNASYYANMYQGIIEGAENSAENFRFRYSRRDEIEADIIGCRYLQYLGYDGNIYLSMLQKLGTDNDKKYSKKSTHPKTELRIEVIKALLNNNTL